MAAELTWRAMGTTAHVIVNGSDAHLAYARERVEELEEKWSRFRRGSELNRLNARSGEVTTVSDDTRELVERSVEGWHLSGGAFDPTLLGDILRAGYDRTFSELEPDARERWSPFVAGCDGVSVTGCDVTLPPGVGLDSGGIGKGLAADIVCGELLGRGADGVCVNLGGDLRVMGTPPDSAAGWTVSVDHPWHPVLVNVGLGRGAMATSTTLKRTWRSAGAERHHVIDPRSHAPAESRINHATVIDGTAWRAEVLATAVLVNGGSHPFDILGGTGAAGLVVGERGEVETTDGFSGFVGDAVVPDRIVSPQP